MDKIRQTLFSKIKTLNETLWENRATEPHVNEWLDNFTTSADPDKDERLHALYLLSNFMYFGSRQTRELLRALYRDLYRYPIVEAIRKANGDTLDSGVIDSCYGEELAKTRFLGVGNPSESGSHLLYYFRQENSIPKELFIHTHQIFTRRGTAGQASLRETEVERYVFIDDFCGSGQQGVEYSQELVEDIKRLRPDTFVAYYVLFATRNGMETIRQQTHFDAARAVYELDESFKCFGDHSRYFRETTKGVDRGFCEQMCQKYGNCLMPGHPLGYRDSQLLIGFHHNTPDNTLPIVWYENPSGPPWHPIFRRYPKL